MNTTITKFASKVGLALTLISFLTISSTHSADADEFAYIGKQAKKIQRKTKLLVKETIHYRHTPQYQALVSESAALLDCAILIEQIAKHGRDIQRLELELARMNLAFHRLEDLFDATEVAARRGRGYIDGPTAHVENLLCSIEECIDYIRRDVRKLKRGYRKPTYVAPKSIKTKSRVYNNGCPTYGRPYYNGSRGFSLSLGGGSSRIQINF